MTKDQEVEMLKAQLSEVVDCYIEALKKLFESNKQHIPRGAEHDQ